jgi:magnesium transporter
MIKTICFTNGSIIVDHGSHSILEIYKKKTGIMWVDVHLENHELSHEEMLLLSESFKFHEMSIEDCLFPQYYPKVEAFENYVFSAVHGIQLKPKYFQEFENSIYELNIFIGKNLLVTVHTEELFFLETIFEKAKVKPQIEMKSLENLLYNIFDKVVSSYELVLEKIDDIMEDLEDDIISDPENEDMEKILDTKRIIFAIKKVTESQQAAYFYFTRASDNLISKEYLVYFRDIYTHCARINQSIVVRSQMVVSLLEVYMSSVTVKLTEVMKFLTVIATIVMPIIVVSGYYGMNLEFPEHVIFGENGLWFLATGIMFIFIIIMFIYFKKKKWF